jgi:hypothetical protein
VLVWLTVVAVAAAAVAAVATAVAATAAAATTSSPSSSSITVLCVSLPSKSWLAFSSGTWVSMNELFSVGMAGKVVGGCV